LLRTLRPRRQIPRVTAEIEQVELFVGGLLQLGQLGDMLRIADGDCLRKRDPADVAPGTLLRC